MCSATTPATSRRELGPGLLSVSPLPTAVPPPHVVLPASHHSRPATSSSTTAPSRDHTCPDTSSNLLRPSRSRVSRCAPRARCCVTVVYSAPYAVLAVRPLAPARVRYILRPGVVSQTSHCFSPPLRYHRHRRPSSRARAIRAQPHSAGFVDTTIGGAPQLGSRLSCARNFPSGGSRPRDQRGAYRRDVRQRWGPAIHALTLCPPPPPPPPHPPPPPPRAQRCSLSRSSPATIEL